MQNVAMDEAVRLLGAELGKMSETVTMGTVEVEKQVLEKHARIGKRRAFIGFVLGGTACATIWRASGSKRRLLGAMTSATGAFAGMTYGVVSIRHDLFTEMLSLPSEQSPFADRSRAILFAKLPTNEFVLEIQEKMKENGSLNDVWSEPVNLQPSYPTEAKPVISGRSLKASRLSEAREKTQDEELPNSITPWFFAEAPPSSASGAQYDDNTPPLSRDPYARPQARNQESNNEDDAYYFDLPPGSKDDGGKPTTWEEIRRRAAGKGGN